MSAQLMRSAVEKAYDGEKWKTKVSRMTDKQIIAIYYSFLDKGKLK